MKVGILGSGDVAKALGTGFVASGHRVLLGSRTAGNAKIAEWVKTTGGSGSGGTFEDAAKFGEVVVVATHGVATPEAVTAAGPDHLAGKVVIDVTNPLNFEGRGPPSLAIGFNTSAGEELQKLVPKARVVKAFNIIGNAHFYRPTFPGGPPDMFICGNDAAAKRTATEILHEFGWPSVIDIGGIEGSRELEALCILWVKSALQLQSFDIGFKLLRK
jgi:8-hydroxy-5-deazaflavin:NADPH oxidoreductase